MTTPSSDTSQNNTPRPAKVIWALITIIGVIIGIIADSVNVFERFKKPFQTSETNTQTILKTAIHQAESAISKAKIAEEKEQFKKARYELQIAIQELENMPKRPGIENKIKTKKSEYMKIINQIDKALEKQPCYEKAWNCQEYPVKLDDSSFN